jgi:hypothetical protein
MFRPLYEKLRQFQDAFAKLFERTPVPRADLRTRLAMESMEDRTVPTTVSIPKITDLTESGVSTAVFR